MNKLNELLKEHQFALLRDYIMERIDCVNEYGMSVQNNVYPVE